MIDNTMEHDFQDQIALIYIPDYIVNGLKSRGSSLVEFENILKKPLRRYVSYQLQEVDVKPVVPFGNIANTHAEITRDHEIVKEYLSKKLSKYDIEDLIIWNSNYNLKFSNSTYNNSIFSVLYPANYSYLDPTTPEYDRERVHKTLEALYENDNTMRITNNQDVLPFEFHQGTDCLFVILKNGFSNYILDNNKDTKVFVYSKLLNALVKSFGEKRVINSFIVYDYLIMLKQL